MYNIDNAANISKSELKMLTQSVKETLDLYVKLRERRNVAEMYGLIKIVNGCDEQLKKLDIDLKYIHVLFR